MFLLSLFFQSIIYAIFSLPVARVKPSVLGLWVTYSTTVLAVLNQPKALLASKIIYNIGHIEYTPYEHFLFLDRTIDANTNEFSVSTSIDAL